MSCLFFIIKELYVMSQTELDLLKQQAKELGITFGANISANTLKQRIALHIKEQYEHEIKQEENQKIEQLRSDNLKLVHVIVTPNDPTKQVLQGEVFSVGNSVLGTLTRFIPFGENWLIEEIFYKTLKEKEYQLITTKTDAKGISVPISKMVKAYNIQVLPLPTEDEVSEWARLQQARNAMD